MGMFAVQAVADLWQFCARKCQSVFLASGKRVDAVNSLALVSASCCPMALHGAPFITPDHFGFALSSTP